MDRIFPQMNWSLYFEWLVPADMRSYLASDPEVILAEPAFFDRLAALLAKTDKRVLANYVSVFKKSINLIGKKHNANDISFYLGYLALCLRLVFPAGRALRRHPTGVSA
jgi:hypothetical protein